jgi:hypothetical protein
MDKWIVSYSAGGDEGYENATEWASDESFDTEEEARAFFAELIADPPSMGAYPMDRATLEDPYGRTIATWDAESGTPEGETP